MTVIEPILKKLGLEDKEIAVYLALLASGPVPVRKIALDAKINRGTTYDILKGLIQLGLASYYHEDTHKHFVAEDPSVLKKLVGKKKEALSQTEQEVSEALPELRSLYDRAGTKPVVKYYEGNRGIRTILEDIIEVVAQLERKEYAVFSSSTLRAYLHRAYPDFTKDRITRGIRVHAIALGEGGSLHGLDQRRWLTKEEKAPTYILLYGDKMAMISIDEQKELHGVLIEDSVIVSTQRDIFSRLWNLLPEEASGRRSALKLART